MAAFVGCSGWSYGSWRGSVYPPSVPPSQWFALYAERFGTVEINNTFYRLPTPEAVDRWRAQAPPGFVFSVKLSQYGSHRERLKDPKAWLPNYLERTDRLDGHLGPNLVQLPPRWGRDPGRLDDFLAATAGGGRRWAVEFRDRSWLHDDVYAVLEEHAAALCVHDLLDDHPWVRTAGWSYVRFHGPAARQHRYVGRYTGRRLRRPAERIAAWLDDGADVYAYFNNDTNGDAVLDATWLQERLQSHPERPRR